ncbi:hypothetical protein [Holospora curviuscula]|uniref:Uncharacterized protein n=1 Tax=Holospora curviuscula TaxID=1082868 RepID=A0A2S5R8V7_9PROT|nr:hypothetical protein [Holospora curviuscula]PPE03622.1 hypothetical protein HCUR_00919 [Holospora curviuscula]
MGVNHCGIPHDSFRISIYCKGIENHFPHTDFGSSYQLLMNPRAFPRKILARDATAHFSGNPHHGIDKFPVIVYQYVLNLFLSQTSFLLFLPIGRLESLAILSSVVTKRINLITLNYKCRHTLVYFINIPANDAVAAMSLMGLGLSEGRFFKTSVFETISIDIFFLTKILQIFSYLRSDLLSPSL